MAITPPTPPIPEELPIARLYLNDVETILQILLAAEAEHRAGLPADHYSLRDAVKVQFTLSKYKDEQQQCDEVRDLSELAKRATVFNMKVSRRPFDAEISIGFHANTLSTSGSMPYGERMGLFHKVEHIFQLRRMWWRNFVRKIGRSLPWWLSFILMFVWFYPILYFGDYLTKFVSKFWALAISLSLGMFCFVSVWIGGWNGSVVEFQPSSKRVKVREEAIARVGWETVKALFYIVGTIITLSIIHKYLPWLKP
jgi:hypothetical protein